MRRASGWCVALAYALLSLFLVVEGRLRRGEEAKSLEAGAADQGTTRLIGAAHGVAGLGVPLLALLPAGRAARRPAVQLAGLGVMAGGLLLKVWAMLTLGRYYTRTLRVAGDQPLVDTGPYRLVRHPGYLAAIAMWVGFGLALAGRLGALAAGAAMAAAYGRRIAAEEAMLREALGEPYRAYARRTWRLVPPLY
ncbi:MAG TPA: isoprenylcysteine carboxylmethyltransferase family protein [Thermomicrobiales bacterium]|nr:isoprenylcysteine carboxylmethyltransferase family protein [Thermomicrobiales bacterium]